MPARIRADDQNPLAVNLYAINLPRSKSRCLLRHGSVSLSEQTGISPAGVSIFTFLGQEGSKCHLQVAFRLYT